MLVHRITFHVKSGRVDSAVEMIKQAQTMIENPHGARIYTPNIAPFNRVVYDLEFETLAELEEFWAKWWALPDTPAFMEKWNELVDTGGGSKVWNLVE